LNGILIVDKPEGWTSHDVVAKLRGALKMKRIGHGGTLDPMATGVLPIFIGLATKLSGTSTEANKEYIAGLRLGVVTDTQDITGQILSETNSTVTAAELAEILPRFTGTIQQIPPMYSAKKQGGKKLYELARKGIEVAREPRTITIHTLELLESPQSETQNSSDFILNVLCSKGTYVRTLCHDIGAALGTGGTMSSLRRTCSGEHKIEHAHTLENILTAIDNDEFAKLLIEVEHGT